MRATLPPTQRWSARQGRLMAVTLAVLTFVTLAACKNTPGANGEYAVRDRGLQHGSP